jgi:two-component system OmpR family sensor kinase
MAKTAWYRSLYWRIGTGFVLFLAAVLTVQGLALVWLISQMAVGPGPPPPDVARLVARELSAALTADSRLDIEQFLRQEYEERLPLIAVMRDGRVISSDGTTPSDQLVAEVRERLTADPESLMRAGRGDRGRGSRGPRPGRGSGFERGRGPGPGMFGGASRVGGPAGPVVVDGQLVGVIVANPRSTFQQLGPTLLVVGLLLVGIGTAAAAVLVFRPVRRRLRSLEDTARQVGAGDLGARAREDGGDEVAALAHAFNQMTTDLQARAAQLQAADRARRLLLADVSHELMTPLTAMRGYLETISMHAQTLDSETRERYLSIIGDETRRVEHIVGDLLDLARLEGGGDSFDPQDVALEDVFGRVVARHERAAAMQGVTLTTRVAAGAEIIVGDSLRLEQALQNLAANALRHTPAGGRIALTAEPQGGEIVIVVRDTGSGIAPEHLAHVFDRFYKTDPSRAGEATGSGLGLSIVKAICERHGGRISVTSEPGEGTWFTIRLPHA